MLDFLAQYGLFLAKTLTLLAAFVVAVSVLANLAQHARGQPSKVGAAGTASCPSLHCRAGAGSSVSPDPAGAAPGPILRNNSIGSLYFTNGMRFSTIVSGCALQTMRSSSPCV